MQTYEYAQLKYELDFADRTVLIMEFSVWGGRGRAGARVGAVDGVMWGGGGGGVGHLP